MKVWSAEKSVEEIVATDLEVCSYVVQDAGEQAYAKRVMRSA